MKLSHMGRLVTLMTTVTLAFTGCGGAGTTSAAPLGAIGPLEGNGSRMLPGASKAT